MKIEHAIKEYLLEIEIRKFTPKTIKSYRNIVNVNVELSPPFYAWVFTFGARMKIVGDEKAVAEMKKYVERLYKLYEDDSKK